MLHLVLLVHQFHHTGYDNPSPRTYVHQNPSIPPIIRELQDELCEQSVHNIPMSQQDSKPSLLPAPQSVRPKSSQATQTVGHSDSHVCQPHLEALSEHAGMQQLDSRASTETSHVEPQLDLMKRQRDYYRNTTRVNSQLSHPMGGAPGLQIGCHIPSSDIRTFPGECPFRFS